MADSFQSQDAQNNSHAARQQPEQHLSAVEQERFNQFIQAENERLNRLIRNLYLHFQLKHYSERDLYDRICQEVARYFRAASCELYIVHYEVEVTTKSASSPPDVHGNLITQEPKKWLELVGAFGPARRALQQKYITKRDRIRYELPIEKEPSRDQVSMTLNAFLADNPTGYFSACDYRYLRERAKLSPLKHESRRQVVWYQDGLFNSCQCNLMAPLLREGRDFDETRSEQGGAAESAGDTRTNDAAEHQEGNGPKSTIPYHRRIGLIKLENRIPYGIEGFADIPTETSRDVLFFANQWEIVALRPYVRDLKGSVKKNPFLPIQNNVGWQQYYEDHPMGARYFQQLVTVLRELRQRQDKATIQSKLTENYKQWSDWLENLLECLIRLEAWVQFLQQACLIMAGVSKPSPSLDKPMPTLFNAYNLHGAFLQYLRESPTTDVEDARQELRVYNTLRQALHSSLITDDAKRQSLAELEMLLLRLEIVKHRLLTLRDELPENKGFEKRVAQINKDLVTIRKNLKAYGKSNPHYKSMRDAITRLKGCGLLDNTQRLSRARCAAYLDILDDIRPIIEPQITEIIKQNSQGHAEKIGMFLLKIAEGDSEAYKDKMTEVRRTLVREALDNSKVPDYSFEDALDRGVLFAVQEICETVNATPLTDPDLVFDYELFSEEAEAYRIIQVVKNILAGNDEEPADAPRHKQYNFICSQDKDLCLVEGERHDSVTHVICKTARALAASTMCAATFHQIDEKQLVFIASHVVKVLDNHLLHQSRLRGLEFDFKALDILGLDSFDLELLDTIGDYAALIARTLHYLLVCETLRVENEPPVFPDDVLLKSGKWQPKKLVAEIGAYLDQPKDEFKYPLVKTDALFEPDVCRAILQRIYACASNFGFLVECVNDSEQSPCELTLASRKISDSGMKSALAKIVICSEPHGTGDDVRHALVLSIGLDNDALYARNTGALWFAMEALKDVLEILEMVSGEQYVTTSHE